MFDGLHIDKRPFELGEDKMARRKVFKRVYGFDPPDDTVVVYLNGNYKERTKNNLAAVPIKAYRNMRRNNLFSTDPDITKTAIMVYSLLDKIKKIKVVR